MMNKEKEFNNILDECLERVIGGETVEQCLAAYPEYAAELEPLLRTALAAREASAIEPRPEFRERAGYQFQAAIREMASPKRHGVFGWQPRWATAVIVIIFLLLAGSGTVVAAGNSMPDGPLYQVKLATEAVRLTLTPSALGKAELYVELADKRVAEIIKMADKGKVEQVERAAQRLNTQLIAMANLPMPGEEGMLEADMATFEAAEPETAVAVSPRAQIEEAAPAPTLVPAPMPAPAEAPASEEVPPAEAGEAPQVAVAEAPRAQLRKEPSAGVEEAPLAAAEEAPVVAAPEITVPPEDVSPGKGGGKSPESDEQARLKTVLSRAAENTEALLASLEEAPESVKPALRQAIEQAIAGYEQALRNLD